MAKREYEIKATPGQMGDKVKFDHLYLYIEADNEEDARSEFDRNIVNKFYCREIISIRLHK